MKTKHNKTIVPTGIQPRFTLYEITILQAFCKSGSFKRCAQWLNISDEAVRKFLHAAVVKLSQHPQLYLQWLNQPGLKIVREPSARQHDFLEAPLHTHQLPARLYNNLTALGCKNLAHVFVFSSQDLLGMKGIGEKSLKVLRNLLQAQGCAALLKA